MIGKLTRIAVDNGWVSMAAPDDPCGLYVYAEDEIERFRQFEADVFHLLGEYGGPDRFGNCRCGVTDCPAFGRVHEWLRQRWVEEDTK